MYLQSMEEKGRCLGAMYNYRRVLRQFCSWLPEDRQVNENSLETWLAYMQEEGRKEQEIKNHRTVLRYFLSYLGVEEEKKVPQPVSLLTREEYHLILQTAKLMGRRRTYLIIKTIVNTGVRQEELQQLTVEALQQGSAWMLRWNRKHLVLFLDPLRSELLEYAAEEGIDSGLIFVSKNGAMGHSHIWKEVKQVCRQAGLSEEKGKPNSLYKLYQATYYQVCKADPIHANEKFQKLLIAEDEVVSWH